MNTLSKIGILAASFLVISVPQKGLAQNDVTAKSFAVFVASYNRSGRAAVGGVAGTAFFVSRTRAITAYHVLQPKSFAPHAGFERVKVWLVHEGEPAIEIAPRFLRYDASRDRTEIVLPKEVSAKFVFKTGSARASETVQTEGFPANSTGPVLARSGEDLTIVAVPHLQRESLKGKVVVSSRVTLSAADVHLASAPCLRLDYRPIVGFSGGPVIAGGRVVAMNSFADPATRTSTWALRLDSLN